MLQFAGIGQASHQAAAYLWVSHGNFSQHHVVLTPKRNIRPMNFGAIKVNKLALFNAF
jgi:hypothetical protein